MKNLRTFIKHVIRLNETQVRLIKAQAARGDVNPATKALANKFAIQLSSAAERGTDQAWQKNTMSLIPQLASQIVNQAFMVQRAMMIDQMQDTDEAPELSDEDNHLMEQANKRVTDILTQMLKDAKAGEVSSLDDIVDMATRIVSNIKKTFAATARR